MVFNYLARIFGLQNNEQTALATQANPNQEPVSVKQIPGWVDFKDLQKVDESYRFAFIKAQNRLNEILHQQPASPINVEGQVLQGVLIDASTSQIDGAGGVLGRAGPTHLRSTSKLPAMGIMDFDFGDLQRLKEKGELEDVILHEMFHVLGFGTLWRLFGLMTEPAPNDPQYTGPNAVSEYRLLNGIPDTPTIPVANTGGPGTAYGHWRETTFGTELNTGFLNGPHRPLSRMSIAALGDLGYITDLNLADPYQLPKQSEISNMRASISCCGVQRPEFLEVQG